MRLLSVFVAVCVPAFIAACSSDADSDRPESGADATAAYRALLTSQAQEWDLVFDLEDGTGGDQQLYWQKRASSFRLDAVSSKPDTLSGEMLIEDEADLGAHCYWAIGDGRADATCYPRRGHGERSPRDAFLEGIPLFRIFGSDVRAASLGTNDGDEQCFTVHELEAIADVCLTPNGIPTRIETSSARLTLQSDTTGLWPSSRSAVIRDGETSDADFLSVRNVPAEELVLPSWVQEWLTAR